MRRVRVPLLPLSHRMLGVAGVLAVIGYFSLVAAPPASPTQTPFWDKHLHVAAYAGLALSLAYATARLRDRLVLRSLVVVVGALLVGGGVELLQGTLPNRYFGWGDLLANGLGTSLVVAWFLVEHRVRYVRIGRYLADHDSTRE